MRQAPAPQAVSGQRPGINRAGLQPLSLPQVGSGMVAQELAADIGMLQSSVAQLQSKAALTDVQSVVTQLDQQLARLAQMLEGVRRQGYVYAGDLDGRLYEAMSQWQAVKPQVDNAIYQQGTALYNSAASLQGPLTRLNSYSGNAAQARALMPSIQSQVSSLLNSANDVENNIRSMFSNIGSEASAVESRLYYIEHTLKLLAGARFKLAQGEAAVMAVKARWDKDGKDDPEGHLFLTDRRLLFEQRQEIAKKKVLFVVTEKELVQQVLLETPLSAVTGVQASKKGLMGHEDHLDVAYGGQSAHFHIDGQDSKKWQELVERAKSGGLEGERAAAGAGVSLADMTGPITQADIVQLQSEVNDLQARVMLTFAKDALEDMENKVGNLPRQLGEVRARGYAFEKALESQVQSLAEQWSRVKQTVGDDVRQLSSSLNQGMQGIQQHMAQVMAGSANPGGVRPVFMQVKSMAASAEAQAAAAEQTIYGQYDDFQASVETLSAHLDWVAWMLEALATASFTLLATEGGVAAAEANWLRPNSEPWGGILFLTDQRIIFEEREGAFSVPLEAALSQFQASESESGQGANKDQEHLKIVFQPGGQMAYALFHLVGPKAEEWEAIIGRACKGDFTADRAVALDQAALDRVKAAPTQCPNCGATFTRPVLRGQTEIVCEFCSAVTRL